MKMGFVKRGEEEERQGKDGLIPVSIEFQTRKATENEAREQ